MARSRYKLLRYLVVIIPLVLVFVAPFSESLRSWVLGRYQLRWLVSRGNERKQIIRVSNNDSSSSKVRIRLQVNSSKDRPVSDFSFRRLVGNPELSFLDSFAFSDSLQSQSKSDFNVLIPLLDRHSQSRTLIDVDSTIDRILESRLQVKKALSRVVADLKNTTDREWHRHWLEKCAEYHVSTPPCLDGDTIISAWESEKLKLLETGRKKWFEQTGVEILPQNAEISPKGEVDFTFDLGGNEAGSLEVDYNQDPGMSIPTTVEVESSSIKETNQVWDESDLRAPLPLFMFKYHLALVAILAMVFVSIVWFAWPVIVPKQLLPVYKVFKIALREDDYEYWEHAFQRYRFHILQEFRDLRHQYGKPHLTPDFEEVIDYVRNSLTKIYDDDRKRLASAAKLDRVIRTRLRILVALTA
jgi:hypothetical protein